MTGTRIIGALLRADQNVLGAVVTASIKAGRLPDSVTLPALLVRTVSNIERQPLKRAGWVRQTDRVSVAVRAENYDQKDAIIALVKACCAGDIGGGIRVSITTAGLGADVNGPGDTFEQTQDFRVSFDAPV
jgi:hypothetical protein